MNKFPYLCKYFFLHHYRVPNTGDVQWLVVVTICGCKNHNLAHWWIIHCSVCDNRRLWVAGRKVKLKKKRRDVHYENGYSEPMLLTGACPVPAGRCWVLVLSITRFAIIGCRHSSLSSTGRLSSSEGPLIPGVLGGGVFSAAGELDPGDDKDGFEGLDLCAYGFASGMTLLDM